MNIKPYNPQPIEAEYIQNLTPRQRLTQVRKALAVAKQARSYWPIADWTPPIASLENEERELAAEIKRIDLAVFGEPNKHGFLFVHFVQTESGETARYVVRPPDEDFDMPHVPEEVWQSMKRCLRGNEDNIEVNAPYDVYVTWGSYTVRHIIPRFE